VRVWLRSATSATHASGYADAASTISLRPPTVGQAPVSLVWWHPPLSIRWRSAGLHGQPQNRAPPV